MSSGPFDPRERLLREQRTAFLINLTGWAAQDALGVSDSGVSTRKFYKILANIIWDVHSISASDQKEYTIYGVGDLKWVPHRFGALGLIKPSVEYDRPITIQHGIFANLVALLETCSAYQHYGFRGVRTDRNQRHLLFPVGMSYRTRAKAAGDLAEIHLWDQLARFYAAVSDEDLNCLASCRTAQAAVLNLAVQLVVYRVAFALLAERIRSDQGIGPEHFESLRAAVQQLATKLALSAAAPETIARLREVSRNASEFDGLIPFNPKTREAVSLTWKDALAALSRLHRLVREFQRMAGFGAGEEFSAERLEKRLNDCRVHCQGLDNILTDSNVWLLTFQARDLLVGLRLLEELLDAVISWIGQRVGLVIPPSMEQFYRWVIDKEYPLSADRFLRPY